MLVRPVEPADRSALAAAFTQLSDDSRYMRFLAHREGLTDSELRYLTEVDHHNHEALVALHGERIVGIADYVRDPRRPHVGHFSVIVADDCRRRGLGGALLIDLCERAHHAGIRRLEGRALPHNHAALKLFRGLGATVAFEHGSTVQVELSLTARRLRRQERMARVRRLLRLRRGGNDLQANR